MMSAEERQEREHFLRVVSAFRNYSADSLSRLSKTRQNMKRLPLEHQRLLTKHGFESGLQAVESCIELNYNLIREMTADVSEMFENVSNNDDDDDDNNDNNKKKEKSHAASLVNNNDDNDDDTKKREKSHATSLMNIEKVQSTLKMFVRDWSREGKEERDACYGVIIRELESIFPESNRKELRILVPGAGMGRLAFDIARRGFQCQGNEFSLFMLFASNFVLNKCKHINCFTVYPWIHSYCNNVHQDNVIKPVQFPDVDPNSLPEDAEFSMVAGDFLEVYGSDPTYTDHFDSVVTSFFLDCAHNVLDFIETIRRVLKPGGVWINFGPLLYHYADMPGERSIEPSYDIVKALISDSGFEFIKEETDVQVSYNQNPWSMLQYRYNCVFFTCRKK